MEDESSETAKVFRYISKMFVLAHPLISKAEMCSEVNSTDDSNGKSLLDFAFDSHGTIAVCHNKILVLAFLVYFFFVY